MAPLLKRTLVLMSERTKSPFPLVLLATLPKPMLVLVPCSHAPSPQELPRLRLQLQPVPERTGMRRQQLLLLTAVAPLLAFELPKLLKLMPK